ncbi:SCO4848 family membrane protein [Lacisediminihabitans changchengi]|uniref:Uncharacterized protein n=1 Tax=Lacisediminihabitans changchengi TaxID=2787634 RepID=A0A934SN75_9MICO|nr:hypothetical protein [Lacisediminihabitans changchengi]MBK4346058.1 hypothetical protein [Lacisediminihabitans changchengi]
MNVTLGILLLLNTIFHLVTWPTFFRRVAKDPRARDAESKPTAFFTVHLVLLVIAMLLAAASLVGAIVAFATA